MQEDDENSSLKRDLEKAAEELATAKRNLLQSLGLPAGTKLVIQLPTPK